MTQYSNIRITQIFTPEEFELVYQLRRLVYVHEYGYGEDVVTDYKDKLSETWIALADATDEQGKILKKDVAIGTIRLFPLSDREVKLGRLAVLPEARGNGLGKKLVLVSIDNAKVKGYDTIVLHSYSSKRSFYQKLGFKLEEDDDMEFTEKGIRLVRLWMRELKKA